MDVPFQILPFQTTPPGPASISITSAGAYLARSGKFVKIATVPFSVDVYFVVTCSVTGTLPGKLTGTVTFTHPRSSPHTFALGWVKGKYEAYWEGALSPKLRPGPLVVTFTLVLGQLKVSRAVHLTVGNPLGSASG